MLISLEQIEIFKKFKNSQVGTDVVYQSVKRLQADLHNKKMRALPVKCFSHFISMQVSSMWLCTEIANICTYLWDFKFFEYLYLFQRYRRLKMDKFNSDVFPYARWSLQDYSIFKHLYLWNQLRFSKNFKTQREV